MVKRNRNIDLGAPRHRVLWKVWGPSADPPAVTTATATSPLARRSAWRRRCSAFRPCEAHCESDLAARRAEKATGGYVVRGALCKCLPKTKSDAKQRLHRSQLENAEIFVLFWLAMPRSSQSICSTILIVKLNQSHVGWHRSCLFSFSSWWPTVFSC